MKEKSRKVRKILAITAAVLVLYAVGSAVASVYIFDAVFPRSPMPDFNVELTPADLPEVPHETVSFLSGSNRLEGDLYGKGDLGLIVMAAGVHAGADSHLMEARYFAACGWRVLTYDGTGVRASEGRGTMGLPQHRRDLLAALDFVSREPSLSGLPVVLYGHSAGGWAVLTALEERNVRAAVAVAPFDSPLEMMHSSAKQYVGILADLQYPFLALENARRFGADANIRASKALAGSAKPALVVRCAGDETVKPALSVEIDSRSDPETLCLTVDKDVEDAHNSAWLTEDAAAYRAGLRRAWEEMPEEARTVEISGEDRLRANAPDEDFLRTVETFLREAVRTPAS